jgi:RNA polymerase sigma factor (sigma-70 family)
MAEHDGRRDEADPLESGALRDAVSLAIGCLGPDLRIAVVLRYWKGLSVQEIARATGVPGGTVKWRLHNANARMRKELDRLGWEVGR